ncbi:MAG: copper amine oxidase N-terminal domain-containing protein [Peptococcia bacterium]
MKRLIVLLIVLFLLVASTTVAMAANTVTVYVDGVRVNFPDQKAYINSDNRTLVPVRFVSEALGADVEWNAAARQVNVKQKGQNITLTIGQRVEKVNTGQVTLDTTASITNDRTMVPLRFVSECLNAQVEWNGSQRTVYITINGSSSSNSTYEEDKAMITSDLIFSSPPPNDNPYNVDLSVLVDYGYNKPIEPQLADLKKLLEKRFGDKAQEIIDYIAVKKDVYTRFLDKQWVIDGKIIDVGDNGHSVAVRVRNK